MKLSGEQIKIIRLNVTQSNIEIQTLRDDLVDHLCCVVEIKIEMGKNFDDALCEALNELAPNGLDEIQRETIYLLNSNKTLTMKKIMYVIGLITTISMSIGWTFRILNWAGGNELLTYGFLAFTLLFVPMITINYFKINLHRGVPEKLRIVLGLASGVIVGVAIVFKFLDLQGADILLLAGALIFSFGFLPFLFFSMYKRAIS